MVLKDLLSPYCEALLKGIESENWILSLIAACTLPDICSTLEGKRGRDGYVEWFDTYVEEYKYRLTRRKGIEGINTLEKYQEVVKNRLRPQDVEVFSKVLFSGVNAYALRCTLLHHGNGEVATQSIYQQSKYEDQILGIEIVKFDTNSELIFRQHNKIGYLNPKIYCESILAGVKKWIQNNEQNPEVLRNATALVSIG
jgi:hypothetical protein